MRWWRRLRNLDRVDVLTAELKNVNRELDGQHAEYAHLLVSLDKEREKRIAAELLASTRLRNIDGLETEVKYLRDEMSALIRERLKSLDLLNQRLMEPKVEAPPPDIKQFSKDQQDLQRAGIQAVTRIQQLHKKMDLEILRKLHPSFANLPPAIVMNAPAPVADENVVPNEVTQ